jgi:hypothetical protein
MTELDQHVPRRRVISTLIPALLIRASIRETINVGAWCVAGLLLVAYVFALNRYAVNFPFQDDFTQLLGVPHYVDSQSSMLNRLSFLFELSVEHRIATLRLIALIQGDLLGGIDLRTLIFFGNMLCALAGLIVLLTAERRVRPMLAMICASVMLSPGNYVAQYWATGALQHSSLIFYAVVAIFAAGRDDWRWEGLSLACALLAAFAAANGPAVFPIVIVSFLLQKRRRSALSWGLLTFTLFACYFLGYRGTGGASLFASILEPWNLASAFLAVLGSLAGKVLPAMLLGSLITGAWLLICAHPVARRRVPPILFGWIAFFLFSSALIAAGRMNQGLEAVIISRYRPYSGIGLLITLVALGYAVSGVIVVRAASVLAVLSVGWFGYQWVIYMPNIGELAAFQRNAMDYFVATRHGAYGSFPPPALGDFLLNSAIGEHRFEVRSTHDALVPRPHFPSFSRDQARPVQSVIIERASADWLTVRGVVSTDLRKVSLWLQDGDSFYRCKLPWQRLYTGLKTDQLQFWGLIALRDLPRSTYRIGVSADSEADSIVQWTAEKLTLPAAGSNANDATIVVAH